MINGFTLHDMSSAPAGSAEILNGVQKAWGFVPNLHRVLAESPAALEAYSTLWGIAEKTGFTPQERNLVYLAIIYENECTYCMAGHTNLSRMAKVDNAAIAAVREGRPIADAKLEALRQFAAAIGIGMATAQRFVKEGARPSRDVANLRKRRAVFEPPYGYGRREEDSVRPEGEQGVVCLTKADAWMRRCFHEAGACDPAR